MRRFSTKIFLILAILLAALGLMGAGPSQDERPPQPFFQDFLSGSVLVQGAAPPQGTVLIACIDDCETVFQSSGYILKADGSFDQLEVNPSSEALVGHTIYFYLVNEHGRVRAEESRVYIGVFDFYNQDLTFTQPLPGPVPDPTPEPTAKPTPTAVLPVAGDPAVAQVPRLALVAGGVAVVAGAVLLLAARRKVA